MRSRGHDFSRSQRQVLMVAVSSRYFPVCYGLPAVLLRSDTVHEVAEEVRNDDPGRE